MSSRTRVIVFALLAAVAFGIPFVRSRFSRKEGTNHQEPGAQAVARPAPHQQLPPPPSQTELGELEQQAAPPAEIVLTSDLLLARLREILAQARAQKKGASDEDHVVAVSLDEAVEALAKRKGIEQAVGDILLSCKDIEPEILEAFCSVISLKDREVLLRLVAEGERAPPTNLESLRWILKRGMDGCTPDLLKDEAFMQRLVAKLDTPCGLVTPWIDPPPRFVEHPRIFECMKALVQQPDARLKAYAMDTLARSETASAGVLLARFVADRGQDQDEDRLLRSGVLLTISSAVNHYRSVNLPKLYVFLQPVMQQIATDPTEHFGMRCDAIYVLAEARDPWVKGILLSYASDPENKLRFPAVLRLGMFQDDPCVMERLKELGMRDPEMAEEALKAFRYPMKDPSPQLISMKMDALRAIATNSDPKIRKKAEALLRATEKEKGP